MIVELTHNRRMVLYFPVSSLVTLFANILQNPQDARARSDVKLMNLVVNFLSLLASDEENGSVKRMLNVCSEFERIAKVVLDKAERDAHSRRKRKTAEDKAAADAAQTPGPGRKQSVATPAASTVNAHSPASTMTPFNPATIGNVYSPPPNLANPELNLPSGDYSSDFSDILQANGFNPTFGDGPLPANGLASPVNLGSFQQPFVPQDLWQMPMTLEWDWADMTNNGGNFDPNDPSAGI